MDIDIYSDIYGYIVHMDIDIYSDIYGYIVYTNIDIYSDIYTDIEARQNIDSL